MDIESMSAISAKVERFKPHQPFDDGMPDKVYTEDAGAEKRALLN